MNFAFKNIRHKFLFYACLLSFIIALCFYIVSLAGISFEDGWNLGLLYFVPTLATVLIFGISERFFKNFSLPAKIITAILNTLIVTWQILVSILMLLLIALLGASKEYTDIKSYDKALETIDRKERVLHFPEYIPASAKDVRLFKATGALFGSEEIYLAFNIDRNYIDNEVKKFKYIKTEGPGLDKYKIGFNAARNFNPINVNEANFTFYVIGDNSTYPGRFQLEYGIAVNYKTNQIVYYYGLID